MDCAAPKACTKCDETKPIDEFYKQARGRCGRMANCRTCQMANRDRWCRANVEKCRAAKRKAQRAYVNRVRCKVLDYYDNRCARCGFDDPRALQIDHVGGDGYQERLRYGTYAYLRKVVQAPDRYQLLCANCNWIKRVDNGEHVQRQS